MRQDIFDTLTNTQTQPRKLNELPPYFWKFTLKDEHLKDVAISFAESWPDNRGPRYISKSSSAKWSDTRGVYSQELTDMLYNAWWPFIKKAGEDLGIQMKDLSAISQHHPWFNMYEENNTFHWHTHDYQLVVLHYMELPDDVPTVFLINGECVTLDAKEDDVLIFPSFIPHTAAINRSGKRKLIYSTNFELLAKNGPQEWLDLELPE